MKRFRDLEIPCTESVAREVLACVEAQLPSRGNWEINRAAMARSLDGSFFRQGLFLYVNRLGKDSKPYAMVAFVFSPETQGKPAERLYVSNIVPLQCSELSYPEYNAVLLAFREEVVAPCITDRPLQCKVTADEFGIDDVFHPHCADLLRQFSGMANRHGLHPNDEDRWRAFVISVHVHGSDTHADTLRRLLIEELNWPEDRALDLAIRYEQELPLLKVYDASRGCS